MVWGVREPADPGNLLPDGDFVGYREFLNKYYDETLTDDERAVYENRYIVYKNSITRKFYHEMGVSVGGGIAPTPIEDHEWPREYRLAKTRKNLGAMFHSGCGYAVSETLKTIIEGFEPGVHQFSPLKITMPRDQKWPEPYYTMVIGRFLTSFSRDHTPEEVWEETKYGSIELRHWDEKTFQNMVFSRDVIGTSHLWRERKQIPFKIMMSDPLMDAIKAAGLKIFQHIQAKEI